jgi:hypothetical protein
MEGPRNPSTRYANKGAIIPEICHAYRLRMALLLLLIKQTDHSEITMEIPSGSILPLNGSNLLSIHLCTVQLCHRSVEASTHLKKRGESEKPYE